jgi:hypothetical protein
MLTKIIESALGRLGPGYILQKIEAAGARTKSQSE